MTARRLRARRPTPTLTERASQPRVLYGLAPGHYDGDGCTFPEPGHFTIAEDDDPDADQW